MPSKRVDDYDVETEVLPYLSGVEGGNGQWQAWCPCHDDEGTSMKGLSITVTGTRNMGKCHSCGATLKTVIDWIEEFEPNGSSDEPSITVRARTREAKKDVDKQGEGENTANGGAGMAWWAKKTGVPRKIWEELGCYEHGIGVAFHFGEGFPIKIRRPPKDFSWDPARAETPPLWPVPGDVLPKHVSITEGESDCGTTHHLGLPFGFSVTAGAKTPIPEGAFDALKSRGVEEVTLFGDTDSAGTTFRLHLAHLAVGAGLTCNTVDLGRVCDPFGGITDLNGLWRNSSSRSHAKELVSRATERVATRIQFLSVKDMEEVAKQEVDWLIPDLIAPGDKIILAAPQKSLKSYLALDLTRCLVEGMPFLKRPEWTPERTVKVGFVQEEGAPSLWARRIHMLRITDNTDAIFSHRRGFRFTDEAYVDEVIASAREQKLDMLIFDPLQRMMPGLDANSDTDTGVVWDAVFRIQQALPHIVVMIVHHANKTSRLTWESIRGSSRHAGEVDLGMFLERHPMEDNTLRMWLDGRDIPQYLGTGENFNVKYQIDTEKRYFHPMDATEISIEVASPSIKGKVNRDLVLTALSEGNNTRTLIMRHTGLGDNTVISHLDKLVQEGAVIESEQGEGKPNLYETP